MAHKRRRRRGITFRWAAISLSAILLVLGIAAVAIIKVTETNYYTQAQLAVEHRLELLVNSLPGSAVADSERRAALYSLVENFGEKDKFELMLVGDGRVTVTSSGFSYEEKDYLEDYTSASNAVDGRGVFNGATESEEHILAMTQLLMRPVEDVEALRLVTSLSGVDARLTRVKQLVVLICVVILLFSLFTGIFFIRSIVIPLQSIGDMARRISTGDYNARIVHRYPDEIGDLCDTINEMAVGLSETDRLKNEFISSVSHELRTPLTAIRGWGETLQMLGASDKETFHKGMQIIVTESDRLSVLVEDLLDFSRLQSGRITINPLRIDLVEELALTVQVFEERVKRMGFTLDLSLPSEPVMVMGDRNRLRQVFTNLIDNAIKYSKPDGVIEILMDVSLEWATVRVRDHGAGIPKDDLRHITQRFFKASNATTGSGIGLAVAREILELHAGEIHYESELGKGTTAIVTLPLVQ